MKEETIKFSITKNIKLFKPIEKIKDQFIYLNLINQKMINFTKQIGKQKKMKKMCFLRKALKIIGCLQYAKKNYLKYTENCELNIKRKYDF